MHHLPRIQQHVRILPGMIRLNDQVVFSSVKQGEDFLNDAFKHLQLKYMRFYKMDSMSKCGILAAHLLLHNTGQTGFNAYKKGMIFQNKSSSLEADIKFQHSMQEIASPALFVYTLPNIVMGEIAIQYGFKGENTFFVDHHFDASLLHQYTSMLFQKGLIELALSGYMEYIDGNPDILICLLQTDGQLPFSVDQLNVLYHPVVSEITE